MKDDKLNESQIARLAPMERYFGMVIRSGYCSPVPGEEEQKTMKDIWTELTGNVYPFSRGCSNCLFNLIHDMGQLYYAATGIDPFDVPKIVKPSPVAARKAPKNDETLSGGNTAQPKAKKPQNATKGTSKAKKQ